ncbi:MAG TPA: Calx-beta domain-containing protein, partial [Pyrinomonadaceae bacterium]|nr:Calx-beta domain-containing protein [Pyrinomonadaceae bacterium]
MRKVRILPRLSLYFRLLLLVLLVFAVGALLKRGFSARAQATGIFIVTNVNDSGPGSLRQAILDANGNTGTDTINFSIGSGAQTILPATALPVISDPVIIDATTQPGFSGTPLIELSTTNVPSLPNQGVLSITAGGTTVRGFIINHFQDGGIQLRTAGGNKIEGNYIGTDATGNLTTGSAGNAITIQCPNNIIGGTTPNSKNVMAGVNSYGVSLASGNGNQIQGNFIGTNAAGTAKLPVFAGIFLGSSGNTIGGTTPEARNIIGSGEYAGIVMQVDGTSGNVIQGNYIGTDVTGMIAFGINNHGIALFGATNNNTIGGTVPGARNVLSGNGWGLSVAGSTGTIIQGNYIGVAADGITPLPNRVEGLRLADATNSIVGGDVPGAANVIAFNGPVADVGVGRGIEVLNGSGNSIRGNAIFSNGRLGIDIDGGEVTPNDPGDVDTGGNNRQNFPVLSSVTTNASQTMIAGTLNSSASTTFTIDFYANSTCDSSGFGEGARWMGATTVNTNGSGDATINASFTALSANQLVTATATDPAGNTSEFSQCSPTSPAIGSVSFASTSVSVSESLGPGSVALTRAGGSAGSLTVGYTVSGVTATPGTDFTPAQGTVTFNDGEVSKNISVAVSNDNVYEPLAETVKIVLAPSGNPDTLGPQNTAILTINDDDQIPMVTIADAAASEGNSGTTNIVFPVTLSNPSSNPITVNFGTFDQTARGGSDFVSVSDGSLVIPAGQTSASITIQVIGDTVGEGEETFLVSLSLIGAVFGDGQAVGTIVNDDGPATSMTIFGQVTEFNFQPLANITVTFTINRMGVIETQTTQTDANGNFASTSFACANNVTVAPTSPFRKFSPFSITFVNQCSDQVAVFRAVPVVVISQIYTTGGETGATYASDYIELLNRGPAINVNGWSVQYAAAGGTTWQSTSLPSLILQPGQHLLIREGSSGSGGIPVPSPDRLGIIQLSSTAGKIALVASTAALPAAPCPLSPGVVDFVGYGTADCFEGAAPASAPTLTTAARRAGDGCVDTENNGLDFSLGTPNPRNRFSSLSGCNSAFQFSASNYNANEGDVFTTITVTRSGDTSGAATVDFASSNGTASQMRDYQVANGTLSFAAGETSKTFRVLLVNDVFAESSETINLTLSNPNIGAVIGSPATVTIADNDSGGSTSPVARQFVSNLVGADEVPATPNAVKGNGGIVQLANDDLSAKISLLFSGLTGDETGAHVHAAAPGVNGPIIFPLPLGNPINNFVVNPTAQQVIDLRAGQQYMNVHSTG